MRRRFTGAILLLYPRRVRKGHGPEIMVLIDDLIAHEGRSRTGLFIRLAADGLVQRIASTATVWTVVAVLAATSFGGLAVSGFAAASAGSRACREPCTRSRRDDTRTGPRSTCPAPLGPWSQRLARVCTANPQVRLSRYRREAHIS
jgi:hypothetical protein